MIRLAHEVDAQTFVYDAKRGLPHLLDNPTRVGQVAVYATLPRLPLGFRWGFPHGNDCSGTAVPREDPQINAGLAT